MFAIKLTDEIQAEINQGQIRILGLKALPTETRKATYKKLVEGAAEIESRLIREGCRIIQRLGGSIHNDFKGVHFSRSADLEAAKQAWDVFLDIRPLMKTGERGF